MSDYRYEKGGGRGHSIMVLVKKSKMEKILIRLMKRHLENLKTIQIQRSKRLKELTKFSDVNLEYGAVRGDVIYYKAKYPGEEKSKYLGTESNMIVRRIQEERFFRKSLEIITADIFLIEAFLNKYEPVSFQNINSKIPRIYRNAYAARSKSKSRIAEAWKSSMEEYKRGFPVIRPEELIHETVEEGVMTRSKSEALIYNYLYENGYIFIYELPLEGPNRRFYPDFAILSEIDYKTVIRIEHQGMMSDPTYKDNAEAREFDYWQNGFLPGKDVYFTYDNNRGGFELEPLIEILSSRVRPD